MLIERFASRIVLVMKCLRSRVRRIAALIWNFRNLEYLALRRGIN
jgi:hypothetical protein